MAAPRQARDAARSARNTTIARSQSCDSWVKASLGHVFVERPRRPFSRDNSARSRRLRCMRVAVAARGTFSAAVAWRTWPIAAAHSRLACPGHSPYDQFDLEFGRNIDGARSDCGPSGAWYQTEGTVLDFVPGRSRGRRLHRRRGCHNGVAKSRAEPRLELHDSPSVLFAHDGCASNSRVAANLAAGVSQKAAERSRAACKELAASVIAESCWSRLIAQQHVHFVAPRDFSASPKCTAVLLQFRIRLEDERTCCAD